MRVLGLATSLALILPAGCLGITFDVPCSLASQWNTSSLTSGGYLEICGVRFELRPAEGALEVTRTGDIALHWEHMELESDVPTGFSRQALKPGANSTPVPPDGLRGLGEGRIQRGDKMFLCQWEGPLRELSIRLFVHEPGYQGSASVGMPLVRPCSTRAQTFTSCDELDFYRTVAYSTQGLGPFRPVPADPAGQTMNILYTAMSCSAAAGSLTPSTAVTAIFTIIVVQPLAGLTLDNSAGYQLVRAMTSPNREMVAEWASYGVVGAVSPVSVAFGDAPMAPKSQAALTVASSQHLIGAQSKMAGTPSQGRGGVMGIYTLSAATPFLHKVDFSDYTYYSRGAAALTPGGMSTPATAVPAYHNLGYNVNFTVGTAALAP